MIILFFIIIIIIIIFLFFLGGWLQDLVYFINKIQYRWSYF